MSLRELDFWFFIIRFLPKKLIYMCAVKVIAHATTGVYSNTVTPMIPAVKALARYGGDHGIL